MLVLVRNECGPVRPVRTGLIAIVLTAALAGGCTPPTPPVTPTPTTSSTGPSSAAPTRRVTEANLIAAAEVPRRESGGTVTADTKGARPLTKLSICQGDLAQLGSTSSVVRSFQQTAPAEAKTPLTGKPNVYDAAFQFDSPAAAELARQTYKSWIDLCRYDAGASTGFEMVDVGFDWAKVRCSPGTAFVAEIGYRTAGSKREGNYFESIGLTLVEDRLSVTVYLFYGVESLYVLNGDGEGGLAHPQLTLVNAAAKRLVR